MIIRSEQFDAFADVADEALCSDIAVYLCEKHFDARVCLPSDEFSVKELPNETLKLLVQTGLVRSRYYGLTSESAISSFIVLMFVIAPNFDQHGPINTGLKNNSIEPDLRIESLWETTSEQDWQTATESYDVEAWQFVNKESN